MRRGGEKASRMKLRAFRCSIRVQVMRNPASRRESNRKLSTDLDNLILLCPFHHRRFDLDGWDFQWRGKIPHFIPPAHVDPTRKPRPGGNVTLAA